MQKRIAIICLFLAFIPTFVQAQVRPVVSVGLGLDRTKVNMTKYITLMPSFQNAYVSTHSIDDEPVINLFLGIESALYHNFFWQLGLSYFQTSALTSHGNVYQFADPAFNNFAYDFKIQNRRILIETKLFTTLKQHIHPYALIGAGEAINRAYGYTETPYTTDAVPMAQPFANNTIHAFAYTVGVGVDVDLSDKLRLGANYQFSDLGRAGLGTTPLQSSSSTLKYNHLYTNEFLLTMSYIG